MEAHKYETRIKCIALTSKQGKKPVHRMNELSNIRLGPNCIKLTCTPVKRTPKFKEHTNIILGPKCITSTSMLALEPSL